MPSKLIKLFSTTRSVMSRAFLLVTVCQLFAPSIRATTMRAKEKQILDSIIGPNIYDSRIRPSGPNTTLNTQREDGPCTVKVNIYLRSISKISDLDMEYSVQMTFREQWRDDRLRYDDLEGQLRYLTLTDPDKIWKPDLFFRNEKEGHFHNIIMPNVLLRIYPDGEVLYSIRISLVLSCPMDLKYYPLDRQTCSISMASYGYTTEDLVFQWKEGDPVQVVSNLHLPRFTLQRHSVDYCTSKTNTGEYSCIVVELMFRREFSYYLIQIYIPCCMLVIVSWVSFWLDPNAIPARVSLGVTTLLTMATQISGINASLPPVSYTKAIDVWTGCCLTFVFGALLEFALVNYASRSDCHRAAAEAKLWQQAFMSTQQDHQHQEGESSRKQQHQLHHQQQTQSKSHPASISSSHQPVHRSSLRSTCSMLKTSTSAHSLDNDLTHEPAADAPVNSLNSAATANKKCPSTPGCGHLPSPPAPEFIFAPLSSPSTSALAFATLSSNGTLDTRPHKIWSRWLSKFPTRSKRIDVISRIFFPIMFALFNVVYWVTYLWREDLVDHE